MDSVYVVNACSRDVWQNLLLFTEMLEYTDERHPWETIEDKLTDIR